MKIGQVAHRFLPSIGGIENYVSRLSRDLGAEGDSVTIFTTTDSPAEVGDSVHVRTVPAIFQNSRNPVPLGALELIQEAKLDLVHFHSPWYFTSILPLWRRLDIPVVMTVHGAYPEADSPSRTSIVRLLRPLAQRALDNSTMIIALGEIEAQRLQQIFRTPRNRIRVIPNGVDTHVCTLGRFTPTDHFAKERARNILFLGRATRDSRVDSVVKAFQLMSPENPESRLILAGPGTRELARRFTGGRHGVESKRIFGLGIVSHDDVCRLYNSCGLFISLGSWEGLPTRVLEAMLHGSVPIVAASGSLREVVATGQNGVLLRCVDPTEIAHVTGDLLDNPEKQQEMAALARSTVLDRYDWKSCFTGVRALYLQLLGRGG